MRFQRESFTPQLTTEMWPMLEEHNREVPQLGFSLDPDFALYTRLDKEGALRMYTARVGSGDESILMGYQTFFISRHPHRRNCLEAVQDVLYMDPEVRKGLTGYKFLKWCDQQIAKEGVRVISHRIDAQHNFGKLFERLGYQLMDLTYARRIS